MLVLCLEGGISLSGAMQRVTMEIRKAHPLLADELETLQNEMQVGMSAGEAMKSFGNRSDLPEAQARRGDAAVGTLRRLAIVKPFPTPLRPGPAGPPSPR